MNAVVLAALDLIDWGVVVVDLQGRVHVVNEIAATILRHGDAVRANEERFTFLSASLERDFRAFLARVAAGSRSLERPRWACAAPRSSGAPDYRVVMHL